MESYKVQYHHTERADVFVEAFGEIDARSNLGLYSSEGGGVRIACVSGGVVRLRWGEWAGQWPAFRTRSPPGRG